MAEASDKSIAQIAYEAFLEELSRSPEEGADDAKHAPPWEEVPDHVRIVIANSVAAALRSFAPALDCDLTIEERSYAQVGYQAYIQRTGGLNYQGLPCPVFEVLTDTIKAAWAAAATAIRSEHEHRNTGEYELEFTTEELTELVAGLDAAQRADVHSAEVCFPLRSRLRAVLFPPEPEPVPDTVDFLPPAANSEAGDGEPPTDPVATSAASEPTEPEAPAPDAPGGEASSTADAPNPPDAATESPSAEAERLAPATEPSSPADADTGLVGDPELPSPSKAPPGPGVPPLDLGIPGPPPMPTDISPPPSSEPEVVVADASQDGKPATEG